MRRHSYIRTYPNRSRPHNSMATREKSVICTIRMVSAYSCATSKTFTKDNVTGLSKIADGTCEAERESRLIYLREERISKIKGDILDYTLLTLLLIVISVITYSAVSKFLSFIS